MSNIGEFLFMMQASMDKKKRLTALEVYPFHRADFPGFFQYTLNLRQSHGPLGVGA
jgi:hypothetical protein